MQPLIRCHFSNHLGSAYPADWTLLEGTHLSPAAVIGAFNGIPAGGSVLAKFRLSEEEHVKARGRDVEVELPSRHYREWNKQN